MLTCLRVLRMRTGKTLRAFAKEYGFNETVLTRIERGQYYVPPAWREPLANALGCEVKDICDPKTGWPKLVK
ncbi:Helix-turn-helix domain-containing protein [Desulfofundulus australicus DSM 11792]|uniref:Helix-turn-helix domain-containing protein n=1 Tax=Desulfofundulus australicus DSM 11792 TaxID=1121425 RepID=A0A1M5D1R6_9FIRM|nr:helix-turn-helix transcriptional regulator [Desulfofundulus australicus]SHF60757.1 Helix-turn-helix domain-containing protein [Desulfofundulus australicus DSM 11792]